jgi:hypothetical protein
MSSERELREEKEAVKEETKKVLGVTNRLVVVAALLGCAGLAHGGSPYVTLEWWASNDGVGPVIYNMAEESQQSVYHGNGVWQFLGGTTGQDQAWDLGWNVRSRAFAGSGAGTSTSPAFVVADLAVANNSGSYQVFMALVTMTLDRPILGATLMSGNAAAAVTDLDGSGAEIRTITSGPHAGVPWYSAVIDFPAPPARTLFDGPSSLTAGPFNSNSVSASFGDPVEEIGPQALFTISVWLRIELSPWDVANIVGAFEVASIPAPGVLPVFALMGLLGCGRRRRA